MQKIVSTLLAILLLSLSACATAPASPSSPDSTAAATPIAGIVSQKLTATAPTLATATVTSSSTVELNTTYENAASIEMQLLLGTFKLEKTDQAVTKEQASLLLPLWTNLKTLSQSLMPARGGADQGQAKSTPQAPTINTEAQAQITELGKQIQAAMTPEQIQAISEMKITQETAKTIMQEQGLTLGGPQAKGNGGQPPSGTPQAGGPGGGGGQPPADGQGPGDGQMSASQAGGGFMPTELVDTLIKLLEEKNRH
jgi:hypothetical protein